MNGLFRRLAQHATGRATTLHAPARLPFHAASERLDDTEAGAPGVAPPPIAVPAAARQTQARPGPEAMASRETPDAVRTPQSTSSAAHSARPGDDAERSNTPRDTDAGHRPSARHPAAATSDGDHEHRPPDVPDRSITPPQALILEPRAADEPLPATRPAGHPSPAANAHATPAPTAGAAHAPELPPLLMAQPGNTPAISPVRPTSREHGRVRAQAEAQQSPNEVHVHIGRIEVTAVQEPAPEPRKRKNGRAPMSLNEYIAKRQRGLS